MCNIIQMLCLLSSSANDSMIVGWLIGWLINCLNECDTYSFKRKKAYI